MSRIHATDLKPLLHYEADTGLLFWKDRTPCLFTDGAKYSAEKICDRFNKTWAGKEAFTSISDTGYRQGTIWCKRYTGHRVVWALVFGWWPFGSLDHINGDGADNRLVNLRPATHRQNLSNMRRVAPALSSFKGVSTTQQPGTWRAQIKVNYRYIHLGTFKNEIEAALAYDEAARKHFGRFAHCNFTNEAIA